MEFIDVIQNRKSIRSYQPEKIPDDIINDILENARVAPSWMNKQCWHFIVIDQCSLIEDIAKTSLINRWIKQAPTLVLVCADPYQSGTNNEIPYYVVDAAIAMEHIVLAATNHHLGTCWIGGFDEEKIKNKLEIPPRIRIIAITPLGYPTEKQSMTDKSRSLFVRSTKRKKLSEITHHNHW